MYLNHSKHMKNVQPHYSPIREAQVNTTVRSHSIPARVSNNNICWEGCGQNGILHTTAGNIN